MATITEVVNIWRRGSRLSSSFSKNSANVWLDGIFPPIVVPFRDDQSIAYDKLEFNFKKWNSIPFKGYVVFGSNGEVVHLTYLEKLELFQQVRKLVDKTKMLIAGVGCDSTLATLRMSEQMAKLGADASLVITPGYYKSQMSNKVLFNYFKEVADANILPVILYNVPANSGIDMSAELITELAHHPNIIGLKDSGGDVVKMATVVGKTRNVNFEVLAGSASFLLPAYSVGCAGGICALANVLGQKVCQFHTSYRNAQSRDILQDLQYGLILPNLAVTKKFGVAGLKYAMDLKEFYGGNPRRPLLPLSAEDKMLVEMDFRGK